MSFPIGGPLEPSLHL